jgi:cellobiose-specific phosphotransferase system component IIB
MEQQNELTPEQTEVLAKAKEDIESVLQKYDVVLIPVVVHFGDKTVSRIDIAPAPQQPPQS